VQPYQPSTGPTRTGLIPTGWFQPYELSCTGENEYRNAEAGPSTLVPPPAPCVGLPMPQPSGGISETTADADNNQTPTEEDKAPVSDFYRSYIPHVIAVGQIAGSEPLSMIATCIGECRVVLWTSLESKRMSRGRSPLRLMTTKATEGEIQQQLGTDWLPRTQRNE